MQSQSHIQQIIRNNIESLLNTGELTGLVFKENKALISLNIGSSRFEVIKSEIETRLNKISPGHEVLIYRDVQKSLIQEKIRPNGIKHIVAVASGKGGVGKSTIAVNLAYAFSKLGQKIALVDADIYGPSIPHMLGIHEKPSSSDGKKMDPILVDGIECISMGMVMPKDQAAIWRGPMVMKAITQLLSEVNWSQRDILIIDLPPGTGDAQLTLIQKYLLSGIVIVSTPQDLALIDAIKAISMFQRMEIPILGLIENMSYFSCPHCNQKTDIFHHHGAKAEANKQNIEFIAEIPLSSDLRLSGDSEKAFVDQYPEDPITKEFLSAAKIILQKLNAISTHVKNTEFQKVG